MKYDPKNFDQTLTEHIERNDDRHPMRVLARQFMRERGPMMRDEIEDILFDFGRYVEKKH